MRISIIVAMSINRVIGLNNALPWRLSADLKRFKQLTMGHCLIMGRKTFESIGRPLPGRTTIVVTRQRGFKPDGVQIAHSLEDAINQASGDEVFIAGGAQIYNESIQMADRLYMTIIEKEFEGDAFFPEINFSDWRLESEEKHEPDSQFEYSYSFLTYDRSSEFKL
ncbi:MAG TPA: dihydrofolate reductase [Blastocatellia bacterium]|nr:dihydrofolate reductase [Blastocatellia bacterium]